MLRIGIIPALVLGLSSRDQRRRSCGGQNPFATLQAACQAWGRLRR